MFTRASGVLLHISSLPSIGGVGDFGPAAYRFVDFLKAAKQKYWQILPLNPTDAIYGNCPYSSPSAFALNRLFISLELLVKDGLLQTDELSGIPAPQRADKVDYSAVIESKDKLLDRAFGRFVDAGFEKNEFLAFCEKNSFWLDAYSEFVICKQRFGAMIWSDWPADIRDRRVDILMEFRAKFAQDIKRIKFFQYIAFKQWALLRAYCLGQKISLIGDIPIYVNEDSADVWANPEIFKLGQNLKPIFVAGVPPDYFSKTGQRWGNPVYDWARLQSMEYRWWINRVSHNLALFDVIRIDHFRGLMGYWEIPAQEKTAINGHWAKGPGEDFLSHLRRKCPDLPIIAEDLGLITEDVNEAMKKFQLPGMKVLHFAFSGDLKHPYLPENFPVGEMEQCVVYTGTHDNNTTKGWFLEDASQKEKEFLCRYLQRKISLDNVASELIWMALRSRAVLAIIPMQDVLDLGCDSRMNIPGTVLGNWEWRLKNDDLSESLAVRLADIVYNTQR